MIEIKDNDICAMFEHNAYGVTGFKVCVTPNVRKELAAKGVRFTPCKKFEETNEAFLAKIPREHTQSEIVIRDEKGNTLDVGDTDTALSFLFHALTRGLVTRCDLVLDIIPWFLDKTRIALIPCSGASAIIKKANFTVQMGCGAKYAP